MNNKMVGIMTFHASHNNGSMLQAYAFQKVLKDKFNLPNEIIDFSNHNQQRMYSILYFPRTIKQMARIGLNLLYYQKLKKRYNDFEEFSNNYLVLSSNRIKTSEGLLACDNRYDVVVCGSDQIWNTKAQDADKAYFLPFVKSSKKVAYAVSFGATNINTISDVDEYARFINNFSALSVREYNAKKWLEELTSIPVQITADPTLLLNTEDYIPLCSETGIKEKYIFWYTITYTKTAIEYILEVSKKLHLPIYIIDAKEWSRRNLAKYGIKLAPKGGPSSYLSCIKDAELVLTSSFHGTIFSVMFRKNFWYLKKINFDSKDDRASFLLTQLGLMDRFVNLVDVVNLNLSDEPNYAEVSSKIDELRERSMRFIREFIA
ncbi:polysaccharide pyruvyl transferase family protein [Sphingobacterium sp. SGR-19]|uniref:polysaccharide pyruvyl transferase family protein n=1 Tax=Sphingobacterium sp. SGR-19 TaxID=2710886 RepID=UPI0013E9D3D9|nr:polysaccharide pyruvyl transferase family protein [Sphingobacterium sp. SGR-19]NGM67258.1 polysaccharide pyruvyl transferase family protein [Sphingobacterium sp. SGR-19]